VKVILYDGACGLCAASIRFVWKRDRAGVFSFAAIQSEAGRGLLRERGLPEPKLDSMYLLDGERLFERSTAALLVLRELPRYGLLGAAGLLVPRFLRDWVYDRVAGKRHRIGTCERGEAPPEELRKRFLDGEW
jgi:predicted DCC family thiol-disulfide oxidoreductase YuxK